MARKLKTYQTSVGFFDLAIAAPSMKAAAEAWGSQTDIFRRGFASETHEPAIVAATMARPGVVLKRPVGSKKPFSEHAELPRPPYIDSAKENREKPQPKEKKPTTRKTDDKAAKDAAIAFEREQKRREAARRKEEAGREKRRKRREQAIATAKRAFERAEQEHEKKVKQIEQERAALNKRSQAESARWEKQKQKLESALRRPRD
jgi:colicin import membrane protein